jgi:hypothetical protein
LFNDQYSQIACQADGWMSVDRTAQTGTWFHVDDFSGLGGGLSGLLAPLEGSQSMWCGARPDAGNPVLCGYATLPGYGNTWDQLLTTKECLSVAGDVRVTYKILWDSEYYYDATSLEFDRCDGAWEQFDGGNGVYDDSGSTVATSVVADSLHAGDVRIRFRFVSDLIWSDQDGLHDTDGAVIVDSLGVTDDIGVVLAVEDFEDEALGSQSADDWEAGVPPPYGDFAGLFPNNEYVQEDPCNRNLSCVWAFFSGSTVNYACGGWPGMAAVPYGNDNGQYIRNEIWSPLIPWTPGGDDVVLELDVYHDLPLWPLVMYTWRVRSIVAGCGGDWKYRQWVYYSGGKDWYRHRDSVADLLDPAASEVQIALGVVDMCRMWGGIYGECDCHSHAPLFDNVRLATVSVPGPVWRVEDAHLFQDNFASDGTTTGHVRVDMAMDILPESSPDVRPGDSTVVSVSKPGVGIDHHQTGSPSSGPAVYAHVRDVPGKTGDVTDDPVRWPVVSTGGGWTVIQMDSIYDAQGQVVADRYCVDLNDTMFTPGDTVWFYFSARDGHGVTSYWSQFCGATTDAAAVSKVPMEMTCLPANTLEEDEWQPGCLFVDDYNGMNVPWGWADYWAYGPRYDNDPFLHRVFWVPPLIYDRYDVRGAGSKINSNGPSSRVTDVAQQLSPWYAAVVWFTGSLDQTLDDGDNSGKTDDYALLYDYLENLDQRGGLYLAGDDVVDGWSGSSSAGASMLRSKYMNCYDQSTNHVPMVGVSPLAVGSAGSIFENVIGVDTLIAFGGCPQISDFDALNVYGDATVEMEYHGNGNTAPAIARQVTTNPHDVDVGVVLSGFSFHAIRLHDSYYGDWTRINHFHTIVTEGIGATIGHWDLFGTGVGDAPYRNSLSSNYPNPFNPSTAIHYTLAERGRVMIRVYNVAGQLVKTLVDDIREPGLEHTVTWHGLSDSGGEAASGVYFYRMTTKGFTQTRKMILLK